LLFTTIAILASAAWSRHLEAQVMSRIAPHHLSTSIDVTTQLHPDDLVAVGRRYSVVVDLRPDGEVVGQPSSQEMAEAARQNRLGFTYVPVPHGEIPEEAVTRLRRVLDTPHGEVLLYCRSGKRAARTWALAEASRPNGISTAAIIAAVHESGQDAEDLRGRIQVAVDARK
jgi:uncharacterized protein (TIGR01244 family)